LHQIIFVGTAERVDDMELDENPADAFPCMSSQQFHRDARAQLYSLVTGLFFDEAHELEVRYRTLEDDGPYIYQLDESLATKLARLDDDLIGEYAELWQECNEIEALDLTSNDLLEFMYLLVHFCQTVANDEELAVFIYSDS
jgi:hypothetical protein